MSRNEKQLWEYMRGRLFYNNVTFYRIVSIRKGNRNVKLNGSGRRLVARLSSVLLRVDGSTES